MKMFIRNYSNHILCVLALLGNTTIPNISYGQHRGLVRYIHQLTPKHGLSQQRMDAILYIDGNTTSYAYNNSDNTTNAETGKIKDSIDTNDGEQYTIAQQRTAPDPLGWMVYSDQTTGKLICRDRIGPQFYIYEDTIPHIDWKIGDEQRKIGTISCIKAVGDFRGRTYEAWFAPSIPIALGPWKLGGLPGLILEAHSKDGEVSFVYEDLSIPDHEDWQIAVPEKGKKISSFHDYEQQRRTYIANEEKRTQASMEEYVKKFPGAKIGPVKTYSTRIELTMD